MPAPLCAGHKGLRGAAEKVRCVLHIHNFLMISLGLSDIMRTDFNHKYKQ